MRTENILHTLHSRSTAICVSVISALSIMLAYALGIQPVHMPACLPDILPVDQLWANGWTSVSLCIVSLLILAAGLCMLNKVFNVARNTSVIFATIFMLLAMAAPQAVMQFGNGPLLASVCLICTFTLFTTFQSWQASHQIFLIFLLTGCGICVNYTYIAFIFLFATGCMQMRSLNIRTAVAALLGIITPVWILGGCGLLSTTDFPRPHFITIFSSSASLYPPSVLIAFALAVTLCLTCGIACAIRSYGYNSKARLYNGFLYLTTLTSLILPIIDWTHLPVYMPLLNMCAAYQTGHFLATNRGPRALICFTLIAVACIALYTYSFIQ